MQACGNDFVVIDHLAGVPAGFAFSAKLAEKIAHRQFGIGCDQILWLKPPHSGMDAAVEILNADGSRAEMCGNGMRAIGVYLRDRGPHRKGRSYCVDTASGPVEIQLGGAHPEVALGNPKVLAEAEILRLTDGSELAFARVDMGNPHAVVFLEGKNAKHSALASGLAKTDLAKIGSEIENHSAFPNRTNVGFIEVVSKKKIRARIWERGAGATLACGSGACAAVAAAEARGLTTAGESIEVELPGGSVWVRLPDGWRTNGKSVLLAGDAEEVFRGEFFVND
jgi:diaminopimelate epimerase